MSRTDRVIAIYRKKGLRPPAIVLCQSPWQMLIMPLVASTFLFGRLSREKRKSIISRLLTKFETNLLWTNFYKMLDANMDRIEDLNLHYDFGELLEPELDVSDVWDTRVAALIQAHLWNTAFTGDTATLKEKLRQKLIDGLDTVLDQYLTRRIDRTDPFALTWTLGTGPLTPLARMERFLKTEHSNITYSMQIPGIAAFIFYEKCCFVCQYPDILNRNSNGVLHCEDGPAAQFSDGYAVCAINGVMVPKQLVEEPAWLNVARITHERNLEVRRIMLERFGIERFLRESGAERINADDFGVLYRKRMTAEEDMVYVEVTNSTPEADGTHKKYFLRVPPHMRTAHEAVAWTFAMQRNEYCPFVET